VRRARKLALGFSSTVATIVVIGACQSATQMTLDVTYGGKCGELGAVAFIVGTDPSASEARIQSNDFTTTTTQCETTSTGSKVGTLVVTPNESNGRASVVVLTGVGQAVEKCKAKDGYLGCIVARRIFSFVDHTALTMEIPLDLDCANVPCDAVSTCKKGSCIDAHVDCSAGGCTPVGQLADGGIPTVDAPTSPDAYVQQDGQLPSMPDAPFDSPVDAPHDTVTIPDSSSCVGSNQPVSCMVNGAVKTCGGETTCCYSSLMVLTPDGGDAGGAQTSGYDCRPPGTCNDPGGQPNVNCLGTANCAAGQVCCGYYNGFYGTSCTTASSCAMMFDAMMSERVCQADCECGAGKLCSGSRAVGNPPTQQYKFCQ
jgi:hypothetical protein